VTKERNYYLDFFKGIACIAVVFFHVKLPAYYADGVIQAMFRFAIPLFFMVSGFYCVVKPGDNVEQKLFPKIKHIFWINAIGCLYYFVFQLLIALLGDSHGSMQDFINRFGMMFNAKTMFEWLVLNQDPFANIMWFTSALLYCYILMYVIAKCNLYKVTYWLIPVLLAVHLVLGNILYLFGTDTNLVWYRNFLLFGIPFFMLGHLFSRKKEWLMAKVPIKGCYICICGGMLLSVLEWFLFSRQELFVGSIITVIGILVLTFHRPQGGEKSLVTVIGKKYSLFIYITHLSVSIVLDRFVGTPLMRSESAYMVYRYLKVVIVVAVCAVGGFVFYKILDLLKKRGAR